MKTIVNCLSVALLVISFVGCQSRKSVGYDSNHNVEDILCIGESKKIYLGDLEYPTSGQIRYYEDAGKGYLVQSNISHKKVSVYDYISGRKISDVNRDFSESEIFAYHADTIFVINRSRTNAAVTAYFNENDARINIPIRVKNGHIEQFPRCLWDGAAQINGKWYFPCFRIGEYPNEMKTGSDRFPLLEIDFSTRNYRFLGAYPEVYASNNMGTLNYWLPNLCSGTNGRELLVGFKASPEMMVYNVDTDEWYLKSVKSVYADTIPLPLTEKGRDYFSESDSYYYYAQYSHYGEISYDPWRKVYYRFVGIGLNDWNLEPSVFLQNKKKWSVMIFDESFTKLGEQLLGDSYQVDYHFVSPEGLYILNKENEEKVANYTLFKYEGE